MSRRGVSYTTTGRPPETKPSRALVQTVTLAVIHFICGLHWNAPAVSTRRLDEAFARATHV